MARNAAGSPRLVVLFVAAALSGAALHCGKEQPVEPPPPTPAPIASTAQSAPRTIAIPPLVPSPSASVPSPSATPPLVVTEGCVARANVESDVQARLRAAWRAAGLFEAGNDALPNEGHRKLSTTALPDVDGDGAPEMTLADEGTGTFNQLTFLYLSNRGCWTFSHVTMATAFVVPAGAPARKGPRDLGVVQKQSSCNDAQDRAAYVVTTLRASETGWAKVRTTTCPCAQPKGKKPSGDCAFALP